MNKSGADIWGKIFEKNKDIVSRQIAGELFIVPIRGKLADMQRIFTLNQVAEYIWQALDGQQSLDDIRKGIMSVFEVEEEQAGPDIVDFIEELLKADLIRSE
jgi:hypothetical protein